MASLPPPPPSAPGPSKIGYRRDFPPLHTPPHILKLPVLPCQPGPEPFAHGFTRSTHLVQAAYPRTTARVPCPPEIFAQGAERSKAARDTQEEVVRNAAEYFESPPADAERDRTVLWNCVNRYVKQSSTVGAKERVTLFLAHANGMPKETWEGMLRHLFMILSSQDADVVVEEVWSFEVVNHGGSATVNAGNLSGIASWVDNARDMLNFLVNYLPDSAAARDLPVHLSRLPPATASARQTSGIPGRTLVGLGHSFGACSMTLATFHFPAIMSSLILVDPILHDLGMDLGQTSFGSPAGAIKRRSRWPSRAEAKASLQAIPFFASWDSEVLDLYIQHGLAEDQERGGVVLTTSGIQEGITFADVQTANDGYHLLPGLSERVTLRWVLPDITMSWITQDQTGDIARLRCWLRPTNSSNVVFTGVGHLIVQQAPARLAREVHAFLCDRYARSPAPAATAKL